MVKTSHNLHITKEQERAAEDWFRWSKRQCPIFGNDCEWYGHRVEPEADDISGFTLKRYEGHGPRTELPQFHGPCGEVPARQGIDEKNMYSLVPVRSST